MNLEKNIHIINSKKEYTEADKIIRYLLSRDDENIELTEEQKRRYDILSAIHGYRLRYQKKSDINMIIQKQFGVKERQARNYINECEYVFGSIEGVNKAYERNFLMECSRKNIEFAITSRNSDAITKAILAHYKLCGLDEVNIDMPDFSALEPNKYTISLPEAQQLLLAEFMKKGVVNLEDIIPHKDVVFDIPHKDVTNGESGEQ